MNTQINLNQPRIQPSSSTGCKASSLTSQFACPTGLLGGVVGRLMAVKNAKMNEFAVEMLEDEVTDVARLVRWVGFRDIRIVKRKVGREASCVIARR